MERSGVPVARGLVVNVASRGWDLRLSIAARDCEVDVRRAARVGLGLKNRDMTVALILGASLKIFSSYNDLRHAL
jgi:hypothetical protein